MCYVNFLITLVLCVAASIVVALEEFRSFDGTGNAPGDRGQAIEAMGRLCSNGFEDGAHIPRGGYPSSSLPEPRDISNRMMGGDATDLNVVEPSGVSSMFWAFAQFLDHDVVFVRGNKSEHMDILVPPNDPHFAQFDLQNFSFARAGFTVEKGVRTATNEVTAFVDGSMVYGVSESQAKSLRALNGASALLETGPGNTLPFDARSRKFIAGDGRATVQPGLAALHTIFMREHNRLASKLMQEHPSWSQDRVFLVTRELVASIIQVISFDEFLPVLLGIQPMTQTYKGYKSNANPSIQTEFCGACYRFGHGLVPEEMLVLDETYCPSSKGSLPLTEGFFNATALFDRGLDSIVRGLFAQNARRFDTHITPALRNFLFVGRDTAPFGLDLASLNLQRGRDLGIPGYCEVRRDLGFNTASFETLTQDETERRNMAELYNNDPCDVDLFLAMLSEPRKPNSGLVGETCREVIWRQFRKLRNGDRFFVKNIDWTSHDLESDPILAEGLMLSQVRLTDIVRLNTGVSKLPQKSFFVDLSLKCSSG